MTKKLLPLLLLAVPMLANAQTTKKDSVRRLSNLVVTAEAPKEQISTLSRNNVPLEKLPLSVSKLDMSQLADRNIFDVKEALRFVPGATMRKTYGAFLRFDVRGFSDQPVMVDGVRNERSTFNSYPMSDLSDVERIEVIKGPASVLQGHSSMGGVLNIVRLKATDETTLGLRLDYGSWNNIYSVLKVGGKLSKHWNGLATVSYGKQDGWRSVGDKRFKVYGTLNGHWENDEIDIRASYNNDYYATETGLPSLQYRDIFNAKDGSLYLKGGELDARYPRDARYNNESDFMYDKAFKASLKYQHSFTSWLKLNEYVSFNAQHIDYFSTEWLDNPKSDDAKYDWYYMKGAKKKYIDMAHVQLAFPLRFAHKDKNIQNQLSLDANFKTGYIKHNLSVGYDLSFLNWDYFYGYNVNATDNTADVYGPGVNSLVDAYNPKSAGPMSERFSKAKNNQIFTQGFFLSNLWEFGSKVKMLTALRYDLYDYSSGQFGEIPNSKNWTVAIEREARLKSPDSYDVTKTQALTYRLGLVYEATKDVSLYGSYSTLFKPYNKMFKEKTIYYNNKGEKMDAEKNGVVYDPKTGWQAELGTRAKLTNWLELTASGFYIHQNNNVVGLGKETVKVNGKDVEMSVLAQVGTVRSFGGELSLVANPVKGLLFEAGYSYTDAQISKLSNTDRMNESQIDSYKKTQGRQLVWIPKHQAYSLGSYELTKTLLKGLGAHYSVSYTGKRFSKYLSDAPARFFEGYTQLDLGLSYKFLQNHLTLAFDVYNVTNMETVQGAVYGTQPIPNKPRNFMVSLRYNL